MENKILEARNKIQEEFSVPVCIKTEIIDKNYQVKATIYLVIQGIENILSTGYAIYSTPLDIAENAKKAMVDAVKNYNPTLIK